MMKVPSSLLSRAADAMRRGAPTRLAHVRCLSAAPVVWNNKPAFAAAGRFFSSDASHDDFAPQRKTVGGQDEALQMIQEHVNANPIMLYMKGSPNVRSGACHGARVLDSDFCIYSF